jgi:hypothetical protein
MKRTLVKVQTNEFLKAKLMEFPKEEYASITLMFVNVTTLALGSQPRQGLAEVRAKSEA